MVVWFWSTLALALAAAATLPFSWAPISWVDLGLLALSGFVYGIAHYFMIESYRVAEAAVVGIPDEMTGQALVAFVTLKGTRSPSPELNAELRTHVRGALNNGATPEELSEVLLQAAVYCGMPVGLECFRIAKEVLDERATE